MCIRDSLSVLSQDHFKFDQYTVLNTVLMGHTILWDIMNQRDALYAKTDFNDEDGLKVAELEEKFAELDGWNAESDAAALLSGLGIKEDKHYLLMSELSGKEKVRVMLAQALYGNPDNLLLDEPTNDLDILTLQVLEEYLRDFAGCVIVVSHDRYFMDKIVDHLLVFNGQGDIRDFPGNYTQYRAWKEAAPLLSPQGGKKQALPKSSPKGGLEVGAVGSLPIEREMPKGQRGAAKKKTFKERQEFAQVEKDIAALEAEKAAIEEALCTGLLAADELTEKSIRLSALNEELDEKTMRWLELSEIPD